MSASGPRRARRFAVVGAGVGGLAVAGALARAGEAVDIYEKREGPPANGGVLLLWANGMNALAQLDPALARAVHASGTVVHDTQFKSWDGRRLGSLPMARMRERYGADSVLIARRTLVDLLADSATSAGARIVWGAACDGYAQAGSRIRPRLAGAGAAAARACDGMVACDGIRSSIRARLFGCRPLRSAHYTAWIGISDVDMADWPYDAGHTVAFLGGRLRFCASTMATDPPRRTVYWYASEAESRPETLDAFRRRRLFALFEAKSPAAAKVMAAARDPYPECFAIKDCEPSWRWCRGAVALLGDAVHASAPDLGQGACQALESAVVLAREVAACPDVPRAFSRYARKRMDRTARITTMSRITAVLSMMHVPGLDPLRETAVATLIPAIWPGELDRLFATDFAAGC